MDLEIDFAELTRNELEEKYKYLQKNFKQLCAKSEDDTQRIYELKRNLETANAAEAYLSQELENLTSNRKENPNNNKIQAEHDELCRKHQTLQEDLALLQDDHDKVVKENKQLYGELHLLKLEIAENSKSEKAVVDDSLVERCNTLEQENMQLMEEQQVEKVRVTMALAEKDKKIEIMQDEIDCLQENLRFKREELEEKTHMLESSQEQLCEANAKINMLMSSPDNKDKKGNSLFAEVDDQRQAMKQLLAAQKKSYQEMKKIYNESQYEIRRLKRENSAMHTELQACSAIFCNADRTYQEKLNNRVRHLLNQNEDLEQKLKWTQQHLKDLASEKGVLWLDSMLDFCKQETMDLKKQIHSVRIQHASLEEQLRNTQQDMARWRFEALKSRCILIDRENLLTEHKIAFKPQTALEYRITEEQLKKACPRIVNPPSSNSSKETKIPEKIMSPKQDIINNSIITLDDSITSIDKENISLTPTQGKDKEAEIKVEKDNRARILKESPQHQTISPRLQIKSVETLNKERGENIDITTKSETMTLISILSKQRDVLGDTVGKSVKFSTNKDTIYNLPASPFKDEVREGAEDKKHSSSTMPPISRNPKEDSHQKESFETLKNKEIKEEKDNQKTDTLPLTSLVFQESERGKDFNLPSNSFRNSESAIGLSIPKIEKEKENESHKEKTTIKAMRPKSNVIVRHVVVRSKPK